MKQKKFINQPNLRLKLKKIPPSNPVLAAEDLPKQESDEGNRFLRAIQEVEDEITEGFLARRGG